MYFTLEETLRFLNKAIQISKSYTISSLFRLVSEQISMFYNCLLNLCTKRRTASTKYLSYA